MCLLQCWLRANRSAVCHRLHLEPCEETGNPSRFVSQHPPYLAAHILTVMDLYVCLPVCRPYRQTSASTGSSNACALRGPLWFRLRWQSLLSVFYFVLLEETTVYVKTSFITAPIFMVPVLKVICCIIYLFCLLFFSLL